MSIKPLATPLFSPEELAQNESRKRAMINIVVSGEAVLVVGSGCSARLKYPTWPALLSKLAGLAREVAKDYGVEFNADETLAEKDPLRYAGCIKAFIREHDTKLGRYYALLSGEFSEREIDPFHRLLVEIPTRGIVTTNYDPSLDLALAITDRSSMTADRALVIEDDSTRFVSEFLVSLNRDSGIPRRIAHLHGRYDRPKSIVLTDADYVEKYQSRLSDAQRDAIRDIFRDNSAGRQAFSADGLIEQLEAGVPPWTLHRKLLWSILATRRVVFMGFSLNDPYLKQMLKLVADDLWRWKDAHHFAIMALPEVDTEEIKSSAQRFQRIYSVGVVFYENREFQRHQGLVSLVEEIANACGVSTEPKLETLVAPAKTSTPTAKGPEWLNKTNRAMKRRATHDAN